MRIVAAALLVCLIVSACAFDAPRGAPHRSAESMRLAGENFSRLHSTRLRIELEDGATAQVDVQLPDSFRIRTAAGDILVTGEQKLVGVSGGDEAWIMAVRDALRLARNLGADGSYEYEDFDAVDAYSAHRWSFRIRNQSGRVWLTLRDSLPRRIEVDHAAGLRRFSFADFNAVLDIRAAR